MNDGDTGSVMQQLRIASISALLVSSICQPSISAIGSIWLGFLAPHSAMVGPSSSTHRSASASASTDLPNRPRASFLSSSTADKYCWKRVHPGISDRLHAVMRRGEPARSGAVPDEPARRGPDEGREIWQVSPKQLRDSHIRGSSLTRSRSLPRAPQLEASSTWRPPPSQVPRKLRAIYASKDMNVDSYLLPLD
jgi:hypothetical protein